MTTLLINTLISTPSSVAAVVSEYDTLLCCFTSAYNLP